MRPVTRQESTRGTAARGGTARARRDEAGHTLRRARLLPTWVEWFFVGGAVVLIPWIVFLFTTNQPTVVTKHARVVWGGFDCFLVLAFALTAYRIARRSPRGAITATATGTMLFIDAWFDVFTSHHAAAQLMAVLLAVFAEIPCGLICFYVAHRIVGVFESSIPVLREAGFRFSGGRLMPPAGADGARSDGVTSGGAATDGTVSRGNAAPRAAEDISEG